VREFIKLIQKDCIDIITITKQSILQTLIGLDNHGGCCRILINFGMAAFTISYLDTAHFEGSIYLLPWLPDKVEDALKYYHPENKEEEVYIKKQY
jgi:hypothetical protein